MCVLATVCADGAPLATPVRCANLDFEIVFTASPRSPKVRNLRADGRVSVGIFAPLVGRASSRGAQLFGIASVLPPDHTRHQQFWEAVRWQSDHVERSLAFDDPPAETLVVVTANRIVYTDHWLRRGGCAPRQFWTADGGGTASFNREQR